jgi:3-hydroxyisobutyrate dehydrogenase-like beta-hydroxyacid dehydrogenase
MANRLATQLPSSQLLVWNRTHNVATEFAKQYRGDKVVVAKTPADVIKGCDVTYSMLSTMEASHAVVC